MGIATKPTNAVMKSFDSERVAASAIASPMTASAIDALLIKAAADGIPADDALVMTGERINAGHEDALAQIVSTEDLVAAAVEDYAHAAASPAADEAVLLAQSGRNTDAGGGLVQQEEDDDGGGAAWGWGLGALALGLALGGKGGGGGITDPRITIQLNSNGSTVNLVSETSTNSNIFEGNPVGGGQVKQIATTRFTDISSQQGTLNLNGTYSLDALSLDGDAAPLTFEFIRGAFTDTLDGVDTFNATVASSDASSNDLLILWDSGKWGGKDYGFVITDFTNGVALKLTISSIEYSITYTSGTGFSVVYTPLGGSAQTITLA